MAGKFSNTTTPGRGYTDAVSQSRGPTDTSGRAVPDERRTFSEQREENFPGSADDDTLTGRRIGYGADPQNPPPLSAASEEGSASEADDMESDEAASGRVQGG